MPMHRLHHAVRVVRACDGKHGRMSGLNDALFRSQAAGHYDLAVLRQSLADGVERLLDRGVDEAAGVDDDEIGARVVGRSGVTLRAKLREDLFRVYECLRTAE